MKKAMVALVLGLFVLASNVCAQTYQFDRTCIIEETREKVQVTYVSHEKEEKLTVVRAKNAENDSKKTNKITVDCGSYAIKIVK